MTTTSNSILVDELESDRESKTKRSLSKSKSNRVKKENKDVEFYDDEPEIESEEDVSLEDAEQLNNSSIKDLETDVEKENEELDKTIELNIEDGESLTMVEKELFAEKNTKLVHSLAGKFKNAPIEYEELYSIANIGMVKGLNGYRKNKKTKLSTFVYKCMMNEILYQLRRNNNKSLNASGDKVEVQSFHQSLTQSDDNFTLMDTLKAEEDVERDTIGQLNKEDLKMSMLKAIHALDEVEQKVIIYRFGMNEDKKTQKEIAEELNMSQANISKIEKLALLKLKRICITLKISLDM